jgi:hypothetical protein
MSVTLKSCDLNDEGSISMFSFCRKVIDTCVILNCFIEAYSLHLDSKTQRHSEVVDHKCCVRQHYRFGGVSMIFLDYITRRRMTHLILSVLLLQKSNRYVCYFELFY